MSDRDDRLTVLVKGAADEAAERHRPVDVGRIVARRRRRRSAVLPARSVRRIAVAAFVLAATLGIAVVVHAGSSKGPPRPPAGRPTVPLATLEREYPRPVAIAVGWVQGHLPGRYAAPTWLPPGALSRVTPYVTVAAAAERGVSASWQLALVRGGDGLLNVSAAPKGRAVTVGFALTTYASETLAYAAVSSIAVRPPGRDRTATLGDGIAGYLHDTGAGGPEVYWLDGSWQLLVGGVTTTSVLRAAGSLVAYLTAHPLPAGPGVLVASGRECRATWLLLDAEATASMPAGCDATTLARITTSVQPAP